MNRGESILGVINTALDTIAGLNILTSFVEGVEYPLPCVYAMIVEENFSQIAEYGSTVVAGESTVVVMCDFVADNVNVERARLVSEVESALENVRGWTTETATHVVRFQPPFVASIAGISNDGNRRGAMDFRITVFFEQTIK